MASAVNSLVGVATAAASTPLKVAHRVRLLFVRHGESQMNVKAHLLGGQHNHVPLTQLGITQATLLGHRFKFDRTRFDYVYTSTAVRAKMTAEIALKTAGLFDATKIEHSDALLEQNQGLWEGRTRQEVYTAAVHQQMTDETLDFAAPEGESLRDVQKRSVAFLSREVSRWQQISESEAREITLGIFGHGGCIRTILHHYCGLHDSHTWLVSQDNTACNELILDPRGTATVRINDTAHLKYTMQAPTLEPVTAEDPAETENLISTPPSRPTSPTA